MADLSGKSVGRYHILEPLGQGGMATVYKAFDTRLEREVAIKFIRMGLVGDDQKQEILIRFEREAKALARLSHPNIVNVYDYGEYEGAPYLVMAYLTGGTLKSRIGKPMPYAEAARLLLPVTDALHFAHQNGIIHRDIKPSNILLTASGKPMLSDFGIAKILDAGDALSLTPTGVGIGTPEYMSPEQGLGRMVDTRTDIYALGVVLYELLTGKKPYAADTPMAVVFMHLTDPLPRPRDSVPGLPDVVERIIFTAMAKKAEERYQDMGEMEMALEAISNQPAAINSVKLENAAEETKTRVYGRDLTPNPSPLDWRGVEGEVKRTPTLRLLAGAALAFACLLVVVIVGISTNWLGLFKTPTPKAPTEVAMVISTSPTPTKRGLGTTTTPSYSFTLSETPAPTPTFTPSQTVILTLPPSTSLGIGSTMVSEKDGMVLVYVPEGEFLMGAGDNDTSAGDNEKPQHTVWLDAFWIDQTEVTNAMFMKCAMGGNCISPHEGKSYTHSSYAGNPDYYNYPVIYVDWEQADAYCHWAGRQLPSEAQWEKAARGTDGRLYSWGNQSPTCTLANTSGCTDDTWEVGSHTEGASPYGTLDMAGNLWEWVNDWYQDIYYQNSPDRNPVGPTTGDYKVVRGGSWNYVVSSVRASGRLWSTADSNGTDFGFRCVALP